MHGPLWNFSPILSNYEIAEHIQFQNQTQFIAEYLQSDRQIISSIYPNCGNQLSFDFGFFYAKLLRNTLKLKIYKSMAISHHILVHLVKEL